MSFEWPDSDSQDGNEVRRFVLFVESFVGPNDDVALSVLIIALGKRLAKNKNPAAAFDKAIAKLYAIRSKIVQSKVKP